MPSSVKTGRVTKAKAKQRSSTQRSQTKKTDKELNKDPKTLPLVERTNKLPLEEFISLYFPPSKHDFTVKQKSGEEVNCMIDIYTAKSLPASDFDACFKLIESTSSQDYKNSSLGWSPYKKKKEMRLPDMRYLILRRGPRDAINSANAAFDAGEFLGFLSFMVTYEDGKEVIYCYEIHISPAAQSQGLGLSLMTTFQEIGRKIGLEKAMLTVFNSNTRGHRFYNLIKYYLDESSPRPHKLRAGVIEPEYSILSKSLKYEMDE